MREPFMIALLLLSIGCMLCGIVYPHLVAMCWLGAGAFLFTAWLWRKHV